MAINHNINAEDNSLAEIEQTAIEAGNKLQSVAVQERQVASQEKQGSDIQAGQESGAIQSPSTIGANRVDIGIDLATGMSGLPSLELGRMAVDVLTDRGSLFKGVKDTMKGKPLGYNGKKSDGIKTAHTNDIFARSQCVSAFNNSGMKGVQASKGSAPSMKHVKNLVISQRMAHEQTFDAAMAAKNKFTAPNMGGSMGGGIKHPTLTADLASGPKGYVDPEELKWKNEHKNRNIWSDGEVS